MTGNELLFPSKRRPLLTAWTIFEVFSLLLMQLVDSLENICIFDLGELYPESSGVQLSFQTFSVDKGIIMAVYRYAV
jgi:hypothetical protein